MLPRSLVLSLWLLCSATSHAAGPVVPDGSKAFQAQCAACHGTNGAGNAAMQAPPLAGLDVAYVSRQLEQFRQGLRGAGETSGAAATMRAVAQALRGEQDVAALARHVASLRPPAASRSPAKPTSSASVGKAYFGVCVGCHGGLGEGNASLKAPAIRQLPPWYIEAQLKAFRAGTRGNSLGDTSGQQMRSVAIDTLADDEAVAAVAAYIATIQTDKQDRTRQDLR